MKSQRQYLKRTGLSKKFESLISLKTGPAQSKQMPAYSSQVS